MTVLLYSYKAALDDGVELKHSLRSVQANLHLGDELKLVLVGDQPPAWCKPDLWVAGNPTGDKVANMAYNVRAALGDLQAITASGTDLGEILYLSDDYFLLDVATSVPTLNAGLLREHVEKCRRDLRAGHWYTAALSMTHQATLGIHGGPSWPLSYELHRPLPLELYSAVDALDEMPQGVFWRTWYGNHAEPVSYSARDGRYVGRSFPMGLSWVSTEESVWASWAGKRLATMFTMPSRWER